MALSLGEKLRQAREARGVTVSEVADQTRISSLYLEGIENDDYRALPGGVFNKGFVKSFAKFVGLDEHEALSDYSRLLAESGADNTSQDARVYRPTVLTDDRSRPSIIPTVILTAIILALLSGGVFWLVNYYKELQEGSGLRGGLFSYNSNISNSETNSFSNSNSNFNSNSGGSGTVSNSSPFVNGEMKFTLTSLAAQGEESPKIQWSADGGLPSTEALLPGITKDWTVKKSLKISYWRGFASKVELKINGKTISIPQVPTNPKSQFVDFLVTSENVMQIFNSGGVSTEAVPAPSPRASIATPRPTSLPVRTPAIPSATPRPTVRVPVRIRPTAVPSNIQ